MLESLKRVITMDLSAAVKHAIWEMTDLCSENGISLAEMDPAAAAIHRERGGGGMGYSPQLNCIAIDETRATTYLNGRTEIFYFQGLLHEMGHFYSHKDQDDSERAAWEWVRDYLDAMPEELQADRDVAIYRTIVEQELKEAQ